MKLQITNAKIGVRPPATKPHPAFLHALGEERFHKLVSDHYESIRKSDIAFLFPIFDDDDFEQAKTNAFDFLIQESGGSDYFKQHRGESQMVGRHAPFRIDEKARISWLSLYKVLLEELVNEGINEEYIQSFWNYLDIFSMWMVNTKS